MEDYIKDGILYCGKCNTPKEARVSIGDFKARVLCDCGVKARDAREKAEAENQQRIRIENLKSVGFPQAAMRRMTFEADSTPDSEASQISRRYVEHFEEMRKDGYGIIFTGPVGTGKTYYAACIANALTDKGVPCLMTNVATIVRELQRDLGGQDEYMRGLDTYSLIVLDDIGTERKTDYMEEIIFNVIDARIRSGKPLIVTTNLTKSELANPEDLALKRIFSRLRDMCEPVVVSGADRRGSRDVTARKIVFGG